MYGMYVNNLILQNIDFENNISKDSGAGINLETNCNNITLSDIQFLKNTAHKNAGII